MKTASGTSIAGQPFFCSWSGGKDSCLAFYRAVKAGGIPCSLFTMLDETGQKSRSHALPKKLIQEQAKSIGTKALFGSASWDQYEMEFLKSLVHFGKSNIHHGVFGDIDLKEHLQWVQRVCKTVNITPHEPLWKSDRLALLDEFICAGFKTRIIVVNERKMDGRFLGRIIDRKLVAELQKAGIDPSGEEGEYHTVVIDGPIFKKPIKLRTGREEFIDGYRFLRVSN